MKKYSMTITILFLLLCAAARAQNNSAKAEDEKAIRANVEQMVQGWNAKSGAEFAKPFAENADYVVINGMHIKGRRAIAAGHQNIFDTIYKSSTLAYAVEQISFLRPDVAVVHVRGALKVTRENSTQTSEARITLVMIKNDHKWEIAAFQNTAIQTPGDD